MAQRAMKEMKMKKRVAVEIRFFAIDSGLVWLEYHSHQLRKMLLL